MRPALLYPWAGSRPRGQREYFGGDFQDLFNLSFNLRPLWVKIKGPRLWRDGDFFYSAPNFWQSFYTGANKGLDP